MPINFIPNDPMAVAVMPMLQKEARPDRPARRALSDQGTRKALLAASPDLAVGNFVETTMEDLSDGVRLKLGPSHAASAPRHALNDFRWQLPSTLPSAGPPAVLSSEMHSFGRVFSGCFYDVIRNIFASYPNRDETTLLTAAQTAGKLLIASARSAPDTPRFFQAMGRAMAMRLHLSKWTRSARA